MMRSNLKLARYWQDKISDWQRSGFSQRKYYTTNGIKFTTFKNWVYRFRSVNKLREKSPTAESAKVQPSDFVPIKVRPSTALQEHSNHRVAFSPTLQDHFTVILSSGVKIMIPPCFDEAGLLRLMSLLH